MEDRSQENFTAEICGTFISGWGDFQVGGRTLERFRIGVVVRVAEVGEADQ
jgi:hypothetical protein